MRLQFICLKVFIARNSILPISNYKLEKKIYGKQKEKCRVDTFFPTPTAQSCVYSTNRQIINTRFSYIQHSLIKLDTMRIPSSLWFLETWTRLPCSSSRLQINFLLSRPASTDTLNFDPIPEISSSFHGTRIYRGPQGLYIFDATSSCINIKKQINNSNLLSYYFICD